MAQLSKEFVLTTSIISAVSIFGLAYFIRISGLYKGLQLQNCSLNNILVIYSKQKDYKNILRLLKKLQDDLKINGFNEQDSQLFGIFFDNPNEVSSKEQRYIAGIILKPSKVTIQTQKSERVNLSDLQEQKQKLLQTKLIKEGKYEVDILQEGAYLAVEYPFYTFLSTIFGSIRVYSYLNEKVFPNVSKESQRLLGVMEVYDKQAQSQYFLVPLQDRDNLLFS